MLATIDQFERVPRILRLDISGRPVDWVSWQRAVSLYVRKLVIWTGGESILRLRGGFSTLDEQRTCVDVNSIIACIGKITSKFDDTPPLTSQALFARDHNCCLYCGTFHTDSKLTRDHIVPKSRGGEDKWENVIAACKRCNHFKGDRLLHECNVQLLALPYVPNLAEYLALTNSGRILGDQMSFLEQQFSRDRETRSALSQ